METLARSCGNGHWINAVVGIGGGLLLILLFAGIAKLVDNWMERR